MMARKPKPAPALPAKPWIERGEQVDITVNGLEAVRLMAFSGFGQRLIASRLGIVLSSLQKLMERDERVRLSWEEGFAENEHALVANLQRDADGGYSAASMFLLKARHGFSESVAPTTQVGVQIVLPAALTRDEYMAKLKAESLPQLEVLPNE
jgi:predicted DNA-binding protein (UPF0251 family)